MFFDPPRRSSERLSCAGKPSVEHPLTQPLLPEVWRRARFFSASTRLAVPLRPSGGQGRGEVGIAAAKVADNPIGSERAHPRPAAPGDDQATIAVIARHGVSGTTSAACAQAGVSVRPDELFSIPRNASSRDLRHLSRNTKKSGRKI